MTIKTRARTTTTKQEEEKEDKSLSTKPKGSEKTKKIRQEIMKNEAVQALLDLTFNRLSSSQKTLLQMNRELIHILEFIDQAPGGKISTRELLKSVHSYNMHKYLKEGEQLGYIRRELERMPEGEKGGTMIMNSLTEQGHVILALADELLERRRIR